MFRLQGVHVYSGNKKFLQISRKFDRLVGRLNNKTVSDPANKADTVLQSVEMHDNERGGGVEEGNG